MEDLKQMTKSTIDKRRLLPESIPWLMANNKKKEAEEILHRAAKFNGITLPGEHNLGSYSPFFFTLKLHSY